jgi:tRNA modification GTPase
LLLDDGRSDDVDVSSEATLKVYTKADVLDHKLSPSISTVTGQGIEDLLTQIVGRIEAHIGVYDTVPSRDRHVAELTGCLSNLKSASELSEPELIAEELRKAADALGRTTGAVDVEELLGSIFSRFCIGK